jgi:hypothetical protein
MMVKDLSLLGRDLDHVVLVDNEPKSYYLQPENGLQISSWTGEPDDRAMDELAIVLKDLAKTDSVPTFLKTIKAGPATLSRYASRKTTGATPKKPSVVEKLEFGKVAESVVTAT